MHTRWQLKGKTLVVDLRASEFRKIAGAHPTALMLKAGRKVAYEHPSRDAFNRVTVRVLSARAKGNVIKSHIIKRRTFMWVNYTLLSMPKRKPVQVFSFKIGNGDAS